MSTTIQEGPLAGVGLSPQPGTPSANPALHGPILLATDGASKSGAAAIAARLLARHLNVPLEVVSVLPLQLPYGDALGGAPMYLPEVDDVQRAQSESDCGRVRWWRRQKRSVKPGEPREMARSL